MSEARKFGSTAISDPKNRTFWSGVIAVGKKLEKSGSSASVRQIISDHVWNARSTIEDTVIRSREANK